MKKIKSIIYTLIGLLLFFPVSSAADMMCPGGDFSEKGDKPFLSIPLEKGMTLIFCGYAGEKLSPGKIESSEYDVFILPSKKALLSFSAVETSQIYYKGKQVSVYTIFEMFKNSPEYQYKLVKENSKYRFKKDYIFKAPPLSRSQNTKLNTFLKKWEQGNEDWEHWVYSEMHTVLALAAMQGNKKAERAFIRFREKFRLDGEYAETANEVEAIYQNYLANNRSAFTKATFSLMSLARNISASSFLVEKKPSRFAYHPTNLYDKNPNTAWFEGVKGNGVGEYIDLEMFAPIEISSFLITNGYGRSRTAFLNNGRVKKLELTLNQKNKISIDLKDIRESQTFDIPLNYVKNIRLTIKEVYPGRKYKDTGLSEFQVKAVLSDKQIRKFLDHKKVEELRKIYESGEDFNDTYSDLFKSLSPQQLEWILSQSLYVNSKGLYSLSKQILAYPTLIPVVLKTVYNPLRSLFFFDNSTQKYLDTLSLFWPQSPAGLPLLSYGGLRNDYPVYYYILDKGDTRIVPLFLDHLWLYQQEKFKCCELMPHQLLKKKGDAYTYRALNQFVENGKKSLTENGFRREFPAEVIDLNDEAQK